jgi:LuxR family maltose regulon positive regulatory protein
MRKLPQDQTISDEMTGEVAAIQATVTCFRGETERAIEQGQQALQLLPTSHWQQGTLLIILGSSFLLSGDMDNATKVLTRALRPFQMQSLSPYFFRMAKFFFAEVQTRRGRLSKALELYQEILAEGASQPDRAAVFAYGGLGNVLLERNELDAARSCIERGVELFSETGSAIRTAVNIYIPLARVQYAQGEVDAAFATLVRLEQQAQQDTSKRLEAMFAAQRAHLHLQQGDIAAAVQWVETRKLSVEDVLQMPSKVDAHEFEYLVFARVLIAQGHYYQARDVLKQLLQAAQKAERRASVFEIQIVQAMLEQAKGAGARALSRVEHILAETESEGYIRLFVDEGEPMCTLLSRVQMKGQHMQRYVRSILASYQTSTSAPVPIARTSLSKPQPLLDPLSERELEVLQLLAVGETNAAIAERLIIAPATVKRHLSNIFSKLGVANRTQAAAQARELSLL